MSALGVVLAMTLRQLLRSRLVLLLLLAVPAVFFALVLVTTAPGQRVRFTLAAVPPEQVAERDLPPPSAAPFADDLLREPRASLLVPQRQHALVFVAVAAAAVLSAFLGMNLLGRDAAADRRLVSCGLSAWSLVLAKLGALCCVTAAIALALSAALLPWFVPAHPVALGCGLLLAGWVYGCYGLLVGALLRRELEAILCVVLLANLDAGWLQNPIYFEAARNPAVIRALPAHGPEQVAFLAAFTDYPALAPALQAVAWGAALLVAALCVQAVRTRERR